MTSVFKNRLPESVLHLSPYRREMLYESLSLLYNIDQVSGILLGGSLSYKQDIEKSDVDLFCLVHKVINDEKSINVQLLALTDVDIIIYQGYFPWTENLYTIYFKKDIDFTLDISLINSDNAEDFFWEPNGHILFDKEDIIEKCRSYQISKPDYSKQPLLKNNPFTMAIISIKKIEKNLSRSHLWNALDQVRNLRRYLMQVVRIYVIKNTDFLGRVDREIEDIMPEEFNLQFSNTIALYDFKDIAEKTITLSKIAESLIAYISGTQEEYLKDWILKHLAHERDKLIKYTN
ncbi:MAG: hypothetical protein JWP81_1542 [Ferruginibacter sp.]|nr:hypothetical protein [Ferruginibacter sp.]